MRNLQVNIGKKRRGLCVYVVCVLMLGLCYSPSVFAKSDPVRITWWSQLYGATGEVLVDLVHEFNKKHPDIKVEYLQPTPGAASGIYQAKLIAACLAGNPPDIVDMGQTKPANYIPNEFVPFDELTDDLEADLQISQIPDGIFPFGNYKGHTWSIPVFCQTVGLYYNKEMFLQAGLNPERPPESLKELTEFADKLTKENQWGMVIPHAATLNTGLMWYTYLWREGGEILNENWTEATFNREAGVRALQYWVDLIHEYKVMPLTATTNTFLQMRDAFINSRAAMMDNFGWFLKDIGEKASFHWGAAPPPLKQGGPKVCFEGGNCIAITRKGKHPTEAYQFLRWLLSPEVNLRFSLETGYIPIRAKDIQSSIYQDYLREHPKTRAFAELMAYGRNRPPIPQMREIQDLTAKAVEKALYLRKTPKEALDEAVAASNELLK